MDYNKFIRAIVTVLDAGEGGEWTKINEEFTVLNLATFCENINRIRNSTATQASTERYLRDFFSNTKLNYIVKELGIDLISKYRLQSTKNDENLISTILQDPYVNLAPQNSMNGEQNNIDIPNERIELQETSEEQMCNELKTQIVTCSKECLLSLIKEIYSEIIVQRNYLASSKSFVISEGLNSDNLRFYASSKIQYNTDTSFIVENNCEVPIVFTLYQFFSNFYVKHGQGNLLNNRHNTEIYFRVENEDIICIQKQEVYSIWYFLYQCYFQGD